VELPFSENITKTKRKRSNIFSQCEIFEPAWEDTSALDAPCSAASLPIKFE